MKTQYKLVILGEHGGISLARVARWKDMGPQYLHDCQWLADYFVPFRVEFKSIQSSPPEREQ